MESLIATARALAAGDALEALKPIALRDDPPALALRSIAMAQLGEYARAREVLRRAARGFGAHEELARALSARDQASTSIRSLMRSIHFGFFSRGDAREATSGLAAGSSGFRDLACRAKASSAFA